MEQNIKKNIITIINFMKNQMMQLLELKTLNIKNIKIKLKKISLFKNIFRINGMN